MIYYYKMHICVKRVCLRGFMCETIRTLLYVCLTIVVHVFFSGYPWSTTDEKVVKWLYIPDFRTGPNPLFLICTFVC